MINHQMVYSSDSLHLKLYVIILFPVVMSSSKLLRDFFIWSFLRETALAKIAIYSSCSSATD